MTAARRSVIAAVLVNLVGVLPAFLTGAMAVQIARTFALRPTTISLLITCFALASMASSAPLGRRVGRWGVRRSTRATAAGEVIALSLCAASPHPVVLGAALTFGGLANALGQPAANALIAAHLSPKRFGIGFGIKQSGIPLATLLGGLAVPTVALTIGWRAAFVIAAALALITIPLIPSDAAAPHPRQEGPVPRMAIRPLWALAGGLMFVVIASSSIGSFGTVGGVSVGLSEGTAGYLVAIGGLAGLVIRVGAGAYADHRRFDSLLAVSALVVVGALGWTAMAVGNPAAYCVGLVVANAFGWGWPGLQQLSMARRFPVSTAAASGVAQTGVALGLLLSPLLIAPIATTAGWSWAWGVVTAAAAIGAVIVWWAAHHIGDPARA